MLGLRRKYQTMRWTLLSHLNLWVIINFKRGIIVLEVDEGQHSSYNNKDERERAKNLINNIMKDAYEVKLNDPYRTPFKILFLRMSPTGTYQIESYTSQNKVGTQYSVGERIVILRQWIIWFCLEFELVRDFTIMYMFHTQTKEPCKKQYGNEYDATFYVGSCFNIWQE